MKCRASWPQKCEEFKDGDNRTLNNARTCVSTGPCLTTRLCSQEADLLPVSEVSTSTAAEADAHSSVKAVVLTLFTVKTLPVC